MNRRDFLKTSAATSGTLLLASRSQAVASESPAPPIAPTAITPAHHPLPKLDPALWIWYPSGRTLQNTFVLFRRDLELSGKPRRAIGWICADTRYRLEVNGERVQWGPAPCDPRWAEADPVDLTAQLQSGQNTLGATVVFFGTGDGTAPLGKPGFLFWLEIEQADGSKLTIASDTSWRCHLCRAWPPGRAKRWYLRSLQEEFDARRYPYGWSKSEFKPDKSWAAAQPLGGSPNKPALATGYYEYMLDIGRGPADAELRPRSIPMLREFPVPVGKLAAAYQLEWSYPIQDYFDFRIPNAYQAKAITAPAESSPGTWTIDLDGRTGTALTFELKEQVVGWPGFTIDAPAGTTIELLVHEAHAPDGPPLLNTHFDSWTRFICREGRNEFETFDFESLRWLQLHLHGASGRVTISQVGVRRRVFPWPRQPVVKVKEPALQRLFDATINTLHNCAQETLVDGMARERQQYSGDGGHQMHAVHLAFGEPRLPARYLTTWSQGLTKDGYFLDCWPAYDRLARLIERQLDLSGWGPILDHALGFNFDCWSHYLYTGDLEAVREPYPRLLKFAAYLQKIVGSDGLLPVEDLGIPSVWIDHVAYLKQRHKQCAFNLYASGAMIRALGRLCNAFGDAAQQKAAEQFGQSLLDAVIKKFWSADRGLFVCNLPWLAEEKDLRTCDRSLATSILYDQCPSGNTAAAVRSLVECPSTMGISYPANAIWRYWALSKSGRADVIIGDLRKRWATMGSVLDNNTLQEDWTARRDSSQQWSHCAVAPLLTAYQSFLGLRATEPGFKRYDIRPQLGDLESFEITAFTLLGPISLSSQGLRGDRHITVRVPTGGVAQLVLPVEEKVELEKITRPAPAGLQRYILPPGSETSLHLKHI